MKRRRSGRESMPPGFDGFDADDVFGPQGEPPPPSKSDLCWRFLSELPRGGVIEVDGIRWRVESSQGSIKYVVKDGTKGKKLYMLRATGRDNDDCCVEVLEVLPGSGDIKKDVPPAARGCLDV